MASIIEALAAYQARYFDSEAQTPPGEAPITAQRECDMNDLEIIKNHALVSKEEMN